MTAATGTRAQTFQLFFENEAGGFSEGRSRAFSVPTNVGWQTIRLDLADSQGGRAPWQGTITRFRIDPGQSESALAGFRCEFDQITVAWDTGQDAIAHDAERYWA